MGGIEYLADGKGNRTAEVIDLKVHQALGEDLQDVLVLRLRRWEKGVPLDKVKTGFDRERKAELLGNLVKLEERCEAVA